MKIFEIVIFLLIVAVAARCDTSTETSGEEYGDQEEASSNDEYNKGEFMPSEGPGQEFHSQFKGNDEGFGFKLNGDASSNFGGHFDSTVQKQLFQPAINYPTSQGSIQSQGHNTFNQFSGQNTGYEPFPSKQTSFGSSSFPQASAHFSQSPVATTGLGAFKSNSFNPGLRYTQVAQPGYPGYNHQQPKSNFESATQQFASFGSGAENDYGMVTKQFDFGKFKDFAPMVGGYETDMTKGYSTGVPNHFGVGGNVFDTQQFGGHGFTINSASEPSHFNTNGYKFNQAGSDPGFTRTPEFNFNTQGKHQSFEIPQEYKPFLAGFQQNNGHIGQSFGQDFKGVGSQVGGFDFNGNKFNGGDAPIDMSTISGFDPNLVNIVNDMFNKDQGPPPVFDGPKEGFSSGENIRHGGGKPASVLYLVPKRTGNTGVSNALKGISGPPKKQYFILKKV